MTTEQTSEPMPSGLERRHFLRGGAVLAGAAGVAALGAALTPTAAHAADGDPLTLGTANASSSSTSLTIGGSAGSASPTLQLSNATGPALTLVGPSDNEELELDPGQIAGSTMGPLIGTEDGTTILVTGFDLASLPLSTPVAPERLLDTRTVAGRENIVGRSSSGAINAQGQLTAGSYVDVGILPVGVGVEVSAVFLNLTATRTAKAGYLVAYPASSPRPSTSSVNFDAGATIANGGFVATGVVSGFYAVRVYANQTASVLLDLTGVNLSRGAEDSTQNTRVSAKQSAARAARRARVQRKPLGRRLGR